MDKFDKDLDNLSLSDTNSSSSSNPDIFEANQPFVLELHDIIRDEPRTETVPPAAAGKIKKKKKKRSQLDTDTIDSTSSSVLSDSLPRLTDTVERDKFYDADESYHELADGISTEADIDIALPLAQATSKLSQDQTLLTEQSQSQRSSSSLQESLSTLTKPSLPP